jgi:hypothetical protein
MVMKKLIELAIPLLVAFTWGVLAVYTLTGVGELAAAVAGPSPEQFGPPVQIGPSDPRPVSQALRVAPAHATLG